MGWGDLGIFGNPSGGSPNLDKMGRDGMVLTDAYSANPLCSPCKFKILILGYSLYKLNPLSGNAP
jgi:arylsulfatase A-like enzyme